MVERERKDDPDGEGFSVGFVNDVPASLIETAKSREATSGVAVPPGRLTPRPDRGQTFDAALDETMRDHHVVFAALAK